MIDRADLRPLGQAVRERRRGLALTQSELADLAGVSTRFIHDLEHVKPTLRLDHVVRVLAALGLGFVIRPQRGGITRD
jgi:y4mF family transcriptional regulator